MENALLNTCPWTGQHEDYIAYHNDEWGVPTYDEQRLFEKLCLEGQQAGLNWLMVLRKRAAYRQHFYHFDAEKIAVISDDELQTLAQNQQLIRHLGKLTAIRTNARAYLAMKQQGINFSQWLWAFVGGEPIINRYTTQQQVPTQTPASRAMSNALKKAGFVFVGPTICYAFMQSMGMVNDHLTNCPAHPDNQATTS